MQLQRVQITIKLTYRETGLPQVSYYNPLTAGATFRSLVSMHSLKKGGTSAFMDASGKAFMLNKQVSLWVVNSIFCIKVILESTLNNCYLIVED